MTAPVSSRPESAESSHVGRAGRRLIEEWLPIEALGEESIRERRSMTALPPTYYLHVWWARRPLVASRAAILGALLPADADQARFKHVLGIHGDPLESRRRIKQAKKSGERFAGDAYSYKRAFTYLPKEDEKSWLLGANAGGARLLDSTAGGGSIPFEGLRCGCSVLANDLNPVAWMVLRATVEFPARFGEALSKRFRKLAAGFVGRRDEALEQLIPREPEENCTATNFLWTRTIRCPYCAGVVPLSPNWRLDGKGTGVRLVPDVVAGERRIRFEIVANTTEQSQGTVKGGDGKCPFPDCGRVIDGDEIKQQAQAGEMGDQLYAVVYRERKVVGKTKSGKKDKIKAVRGFRAPRPEDDVTERVRAALDAKMPEWEARGIVPDEDIPPGNKTDEPLRYGMPRWRDLFSPRQLYGHCVSVEVFQDLVQELGGPNALSDLDQAALTYLAIAIDKVLNYNSRMSVWMPTREVVANTFNRHDFAFCWSYAEMAPTIAGLGYDWTVEQTAKALEELIELQGADTSSGPLWSKSSTAPPITITNESADRLTHVGPASVDTVVLDPPYEANVMYAELSDFFYVWLKRTAGLLFPEPFSGYLTDKDREAVANVARFRDFKKVRGSGGAKRRATRDYQERMRAIFAECRRVLKPEGIMVLMFTHKATGAWDALAKSLVDAGFTITASWPVNTEAEGSLHIKDKNAARSTIFLVCRPRAATTASDAPAYWEDIEPEVIRVVRERVTRFQEGGIRGVDLYLACFGPALEVFSRSWPIQRGRPAQKPVAAKGIAAELAEEEWDPYAVRPEDALMAARAAVKDWRLSQITSIRRQEHLDPVTEFFVLAWDAFQSAQFPADEALKLARVVGVNFDEKLRNHILEVKSDDVLLWDSAARAQKGALGSAKGDVMLDVLHLAARAGREQNTGAARDLIEKADLLEDPVFQLALSAVLNVLPAPRAVEGTKVGLLAGAAADAAALEQLRRLAFAQRVPAPKQLEIP